MVTISILYPHDQHSRFDMHNYLTSHMPLSIERMSASNGFQGVLVERGLVGDAPGTDPAYIAMCHYLFDTLEEFLDAFNRNADVLQSDMATYTDIKPVIQVSQVETMQLPSAG